MASIYRIFEYEHMIRNELHVVLTSDSRSCCVASRDCNNSITSSRMPESCGRRETYSGKWTDQPGPPDPLIGIHMLAQRLSEVTILHYAGSKFYSCIQDGCSYTTQ